MTMNIYPTPHDELYYESSDLAIVAALSMRFPVESIERLPNSNKVIFYFNLTPLLIKAVEEFRRTLMRVEPQAYFSQLKVIKNWVYEGKKS